MKKKANEIKLNETKQNKTKQNNKKIIYLYKEYVKQIMRKHCFQNKMGKKS